MRGLQVQVQNPKQTNTWLENENECTWRNQTIHSDVALKKTQTKTLSLPLAFYYFSRTSGWKGGGGGHEKRNERSIEGLRWVGLIHGWVSFGKMNPTQIGLFYEREQSISIVGSRPLRQHCLFYFWFCESRVKSETCLRNLPTVCVSLCLLAHPHVLAYL